MPQAPMRQPPTWISAVPPSARTSRVWLNPAWLYVLAGLGLLSGVLLVSAQEDTAKARCLRDAALAVENHRGARIAKYEEYLGALDQHQPMLAEALAGSQLNEIPAGRAAIPGTLRDNLSDASIFPALEPAALVLPVPEVSNSMLARLVREDRTRMIALVAATVLLLVGLLPDARRAVGSRVAL